MAECKPLPLISALVISKFWDRVDKRGPDECWNWKGAKNQKGYGQIKVGNRQMGAHRIALFLGLGKDTYPLLTLHACDNPACNNPKHLYAGTSRDNSHDRIDRGRHNNAFGDKHWNVKLTQQQIAEIRAMAAFKTGLKLAREYGVAPAHISNILNRKRRVVD